ncbi:acetolactate decarboxylase [Candidatus Nitrosotenuis chungbukensis]|uniref:acetolactate decarboxylase n=1 Tax=Candidatus Nitrosotenuis chungbukensis TaxID=1353246 RepID=UPI0005B2566C|nr:acetolactate decarboxylase [Candidatus Nitrosotenuis chungbukensis]WKT57200.1 acetolactate decarboxylase [Candidatus Nitrosotenuis chungbukensis]
MLDVPLSDVVENQTLFNSSNIKGTLVGFYFPDYVRVINVTKYRFHFIADDLDFGVHLIGMRITNGTVQTSKINEIQIVQ